MRALVFGRSGQVAGALAAAAAGRGIAAAALGRAEIDVADRSALDAAIARHQPEVVINAAAYTAVDQAEREPEAAFALNARAPGLMAAAAAEAGVAFLHISTDYVFSGDAAAAYREEDPTGPRSVYGASKLAGEQAVRAAHPGALVMRTAWVFDASGKNFVRTMLRLAKTRPEIGVVDDQRGSPTFAADLADGLWTIARAVVADPGAAASKEAAGVYHIAGGGETSWAGLAREIFAASAALGGPKAVVRPIQTADFPTPARRPANSRLNCERLAATFGLRLAPWEDGLYRCVREIADGGWRVE